MESYVTEKPSDMTSYQEIDVMHLQQIENLSKKISDLIHIGKYETITHLDHKRLELIKNFNDKNNKYFQKIISEININNFKNIERIETKYKKLKNESASFIKRLKAYNY